MTRKADVYMYVLKVTIQHTPLLEWELVPPTPKQGMSLLDSTVSSKASINQMPVFRTPPFCNCVL